MLNTFFFLSDYVFVHGMAEALRELDLTEAHRKLLGEMAPVANDLSEFAFGFAGGGGGEIVAAGRPGQR